MVTHDDILHVLRTIDETPPKNGEWVVVWWHFHAVAVGNEQRTEQPSVWTQRWLVGNNAASFLEGHAPQSSIGRGATAAGVLLVMYAVVLGAVAVALFRQRDVAT